MFLHVYDTRITYTCDAFLTFVGVVCSLRNVPGLLFSLGTAVHLVLVFCVRTFIYIYCCHDVVY